MATYTQTVNPKNSSFANWRIWSLMINTAFSTIGWSQFTDTGQAVWTATVLTCTSVSTGSGLATYNFSSYTGPDPRIGMSFVFSTFGVGGNNVTATVTAKTGGTGGGAGSVSVALTTQATDTTGSGTTTALNALTGAGVYVYEIWVTTDSVGFPVYAKVEYGQAGTASMFMTIGTGTNGAGTIANPSVRVGGDISNDAGTTAYPSHFSGDGGRMTMMLWHGNGTTGSFSYIYNLERSYDNTGTATGTYSTICHWRVAASSVYGQQQTLYSNGALTVQETNGWAACLPKTATTGNLGATTHVSPVFPLIGGVGNPMTGIMIYRATDFADDQEVFITIYGVQQTYITLNNNSNGTTSAAFASGLMTRYS